MRNDSILKSPLSRFTAFFFVLLASHTVLADVLGSEDSGFSADIYSQSLARFENRLDRSGGFFHETRVRGSYDVFGRSFPQLLLLDAGSYLLGEWAKTFSDEALAQNLVISPYIGARLGEQIAGSSWILSGTAIFEGRAREPVSEGARATGVRGWDPRTSLVLGFWWMASESEAVGERAADAVKPFVDLYADAVYAPKFSGDLLSTLILRAGVRHPIDRLFLDAYAEIFSQNTSSLELGTKRSEARLGLAIGRELPGGSAQLRVWHGFPSDAIQGTVLDRRSRTEALLIVGFAL